MVVSKISINSLWNTGVYTIAQLSKGFGIKQIEVWGLLEHKPHIMPNEAKEEIRQLRKAVKGIESKRDFTARIIEEYGLTEQEINTAIYNRNIVADQEEEAELQEKVVYLAKRGCPVYHIAADLDISYTKVVRILTARNIEVSKKPKLERVEESEDSSLKDLLRTAAEMREGASIMGKLSPEMKNVILQLLAKGLNYAEVMEATGCGYYQIKYVNPYKKKNKRRSVISDEKWQKFLEEYRTGRYNVAELARRYNICSSFAHKRLKSGRYD